MNFSDNFFNKVEKKTNVKKSTILDLAKKLQGDNMKNEDNIRDGIFAEYSEIYYESPNENYSIHYKDHKAYLNSGNNIDENELLTSKQELFKDQEIID